MKSLGPFRFDTYASRGSRTVSVGAWRVYAVLSLRFGRGKMKSAQLGWGIG